MQGLVRYGEAFKLQVVRELEAGRFRSCEAARLAYGIGGKQTVQRWLREYGKEHLIRRLVRVETPKERDQVRELKERVRALEKALCDAHLDLRLSESYLEIACEAAGIEDVETFKKKRAGKPSTGRGNASKG
jgi:transposase-like protein